MNLLLITKTAIIKQIFTLVSHKLKIELTTIDVCVVNKNYDMIIVEDECIDNSFPTSDYTNCLGIIAKNTQDIQCDFFIPKPFLPSSLQVILQEQIQKLQTVTTVPTIEQNDTDTTTEDDTVTDSLEFIETLANDIGDEINEHLDESIVPTAFVEKGGILDDKELSKIQNILQSTDSKEENTQEEQINTDNDEDWVDLANIIDQAIDEVQEYQFTNEEPIKLILNDYSIKEVEPLLSKLGQNIVDELTSGKEITLKLKVDIKNG